MQSDPPAEDIKRLRGCVSDLLSVLALPAIWSGSESAQIADTLLDALVRLLNLDFAYLRLHDETDGPPIELVRAAQQRCPAAQPRAVGQALSHWLTTEPGTAPGVITNPVGPGEVSLVRFQLGLEDAVGVVVAGAQRADFPTTVERLLGGVAATQAARGLQEARRLRDQQRAAAALEQRVVERTAQLTAANAAMQRLNAALLAENHQRQQAEDALRAREADLARVARLTMMGELTASIAHEINQPLAAIVTNGEACVRLLASAPPPLAEAREAVAAMIRDGLRASDIIRRIRALVQPIPPQPAWCEVSALLLEVLALVQHDVQRQGVALQTHLAPELPPVWGDRIQVQQVVLNLLVNALDALRGVAAGGRALQVRAERHAAQGVRVTVADTGVGLPAASLAQLFNAFYTTKPAGMGLGLAISRRIIEAHGGQLWAEPHVGPGATFHFTLPGAPPA